MPIFNLSELKFFRTYPSLKLHFLFNSNELEICHDFSVILVSEKSCEGVAIYINWLLNRDAINHSQQAPAESTSLQFQSWTQHQHGGKRKLSCTSQWGWNNLGKLQVEIWWKRWGSGTDQCLILTPCCHCAERKCQGLPQCNTVSFPCGKCEVPALKKPQYSCTRWGTRWGTWCHRKWLDGYRI